MTTIARPTPLSQSDPAVAELHRIERTVAGLHAGESTVINGTTVTAISLAVAEALTRYEVATARYDQLIARPVFDLSPAEFDAMGDALQTMAKSLEVLADAGMQHLIEVAA